jgi:predicted ArsR family transcriptional regulator
MHDDIVPSDVAILDLLRKRDSLSVTELAEVMQVTATAVRQRLTRLMAQGHIDREIARAGRGRPSHRYVLTNKGRRKTGANFADLAMALWQEIRAIKDPEVRAGLIQRIARRMADMYADHVQGDSLEEKMQSIANVFNDRKVPFVVEPADTSRQLPILTAMACPYPELAEQDRSVCAMERMLFAEVLGESVRLSKCRLDGDSCCSFELSRQSSESRAEERRPEESRPEESRPYEERNKESQTQGTDEGPGTRD